MNYFQAIFVLFSFNLIKVVESAEKKVSIFKAFPFLAYFDIIQCSVILVLTFLILIITALSFRKNRKFKLELCPATTFEYFVLKGEKSANSSFQLTTETETAGGGIKKLQNTPSQITVTEGTGGSSGTFTTTTTTTETAGATAVSRKSLHASEHTDLGTGTTGSSTGMSITF